MADKVIEVIKAYRVKCDSCGNNVVFALEKGEHVPKQKDANRTHFFCDKCAIGLIRQQETVWVSDLTYPEYLKSDHWKNVREIALVCAGHRCSYCKTSKNLDVHHLHYHTLGDERTCDVIVLCRDCHTRVHALVKELKAKRFYKASTSEGATP